MQQTILIIGGAGYIGSHTAYLLYTLNYKVMVLDNFSHDQVFSPSWVQIIKGDYANTNIIDDIFRNNNIHAVMHFAASIEPHISIIKPLDFYENNVSKTITLLKKIIDYKVPHLIFSSSCAVYGNPHYLPIDEQHPINPINPYGTTKWMIEHILHDASQAHAFSYVNLRYFNAAGALPEQQLGEQHNPETHLIARLLYSAIENMPVEVYGIDYPTQDGSAIRDFVHVLDISQAHIQALHYLQAHNPSNTFNLGSSQGISVFEMIHAIQRITKTTLTINYKKAREGDTHTLIADTRKAQTILQWQPKHSLKTILESALKFEYIKNIMKQKRSMLSTSKYV